MPMKPVKRGYKIWCLCDSHNGYFWNFEVHTGASKDGKKCEGGLGSSVVRKLADPLVGDGYFIFCDNFFTSVALAKDLLATNTYLCGTTRSNRKMFPDSLKKKKLKRGESLSELVEFNAECMVWQDKKSVFFINTVYNPTDHTEVKRRSKDGSQTILPCPTTVKNYNQFMGGVDVADAKRKAYSCSRCSRKWWLRLFYFVIDVCVVNAHILHNETKHVAKLNQKRFRLELAREMLACHSSRKHRKRGRTSSEGSSS